MKRYIPLMANTLKLILILRVGLDAQRRCEDELADGGAEAGEKGVEGLGAWLESALYILEENRK